MRIRLRAEVIAGSALDSHGILRNLNGKAWKDRRRRLQERGGPPPW